MCITVKSQIVSLLAGLLLITLLFKCAPAPPKKPIRPGEVRIGTLLPYTGPLKEFGPHMKNGAMLAAKQLKAAGLDIKMYHEDSETSAIPAIDAAKKLVNIYKVIAVVGAAASGVTVPVAESVTIPRRVIQISPSSTSPLITVLPADKGKDFLFRTCFSDALQGVVLGKLAADLYKTASALYVNNPYGQGLAQQFKESFEKRGGKVLALVPHDEKAAESYKRELKKALEGKPDVVGAFSYPDHAKVYLKEAIELYNFHNFLGCDGTKSSEIIKAVGAANLEGVMGTAPAIAGGRPCDIFNSHYKAKYGVFPPLPFIVNTYDATAVLGLAAYAAIVKGESVTGANVRDHLRYVANPPGELIMPGEFKKAFDLLKAGKNINYEGASGGIDFNEDGDVRIPVEIWKYENGKIVTVKIEFDIPREGPLAR